MERNHVTAPAATRAERVMKITRRLIMLTGVVLACTVGLFATTLYLGAPFRPSWVCFGCGMLGGFVSIQQRLKRMGDEELDLLARDVFQIMLVPIYGSVFALVAYVGFLSQIITGDLFPKFFMAPFHQPPTSDDVLRFLSETYPASGPDFAKLLFWCFVAGFSERFVPQIISRLPGAEQEKPEDAPNGGASA
jgi:hypothetical protein